MLQLVLPPLSSLVSFGSRLLLVGVPLASHGCLESGGDTEVAIGGDGVGLGQESGPGIQITAISGVRFTPDVSMNFGFFDFEQQGPEEVPLELVRQGAAASLRSGGTAVGTLSQVRNEDGSITIEIDLAEANVQSIRLELACNDDDRFWGFGEQYNFVDLRGQRVGTWTQEQGVGRGKNAKPPQGTLTSSYFPMPWVFDPQAGWGLLVNNFEYAEYDLCEENARRWTLEVWAPTLSMTWFDASGEREGGQATPLKQLVSDLTARVGRPTQVPPDWAYDGLWLAAQGGTTEITERLNVALDNEIPISAIWSQDWVGLRDLVAQNFGVKYRWTHDEALYPNLKETIADFNSKGVRFLGYFNPFIVPDFDDQYPEAVSKGYMVLTEAGEPYEFPIVSFPGGILDVFNDEAAAWFQEHARAAVELGIQGWMADFGEWLPYDADVAAPGAPALHNQYPTRWHELNREVLDEGYPDGDYVMFTRSGYTGEHKVAQVVWAGDQEADWSETDGLPTVVKAGLTMGMAGIPFFTHDIAGFSGGPVEKELFLRWVELGAFTPFMRTHDGLKKLENHRFDSDAETLAHVKKFTRIHVAMGDYWKQLSVEALSNGLPLIRHTAMVDTSIEALEQHDQWMLGDDLVYAPVVIEGAQTQAVWLPPGEWEHLLTGKVQPAGAATVNAPIGEPAVFVRSGTHAEMVAAIRAIVAD